jgi:hypothetical protein
VRHAVFCSVEVLSNVLGLLLRFGTLNPYLKMFLHDELYFIVHFFQSYVLIVCDITKPD